MAAVTCSRCGGRNLPEARFCDRCGSTLTPSDPPRWLLGLALGVGIALLAGGAVFWFRTGGTSQGWSPSPPPSPQVDIEGAFEERAFTVVRGDRLTLAVQPFGYVNPECTVNLFPDPERGSAIGVYLSHCRSWERQGLDLHIYGVNVINDTSEPVVVELDRFVVVDRQGRLHRPISLFDFGFVDSDNLQKTTTLQGHKAVTGWLYFDASPGFVPRSLGYQDEGQAITVEFTGEHETTP